jgi:predicted Rossmann-fold nucleotide-binding protein
MRPLEFQPLRDELYTFEELFEGFSASRPSSFARTRDFRIYRQYVAKGRFAPRDYFMAMMEAIHDNAIRVATQERLKEYKIQAAVAFMGGHDLGRDSPVYKTVARLARNLANKFLPISGGGPGAMEATHLGALHRNASEEDLDRALDELRKVPKIPDNLNDIVSPTGKVDYDLVAKAHAWILPAYQIRLRMESREPGESLAVPTWLYGHEPTTALATQVAKYFQNSIREDRLISIATHGVVYVEGKAGTLQEIFQDACLNSYRVLGNFSPMVFLGAKQWNKTLPVIPVLRKLFGAKDFEENVLVTDDPGKAQKFLERHGTNETPARRMLRVRRA